MEETMIVDDKSGNMHHIEIAENQDNSRPYDLMFNYVRLKFTLKEVQISVRQTPTSPLQTRDLHYE